MNTFRLLLPYILAGYFVARAFKQRIFLLGIPFIMYLGVGLFANRAKLFYTPGSWNREWLLLIWLGVAWFFCTQFGGLKERRHAATETPTGGGRLTVYELPMILLFLILVYNIAKNIIEYGNAVLTFDVAAGSISLFVGYFLIKDIFAHASRQDIIDFLDAVIMVNTLAAVFYLVHQGLGITIYPNEEYFARSYRGVTITRTFWFMPLLMPLSVAFQLSRERQTWKSITIAAINALAIFITYTRILVAILVLMALIAYTLQGLKAGRLRVILKRYFAFAAAAGAFTLFLAMVFPVQGQFFLDRVAPLLSGATDMRANSMYTRQYDLQRVQQGIDPDDTLLGVGFLDETQDPNAYWVQRSTWDNTWIGILYRYGIVGVTLLACLYVIFMLKALRMYMRSEDAQAAFISLLMVLVLVDAAIESVQNSTFLYVGKMAVGFWFFALIAVESNRSLVSQSASEAYEDEESDASSTRVLPQESS